MERFDEFTRLLGNAGASRRRTLRVLGNLLLGSALGGSAVRLGLREVTEAEANYHKAKPKRKRKPQSERKAKKHGKRKGNGTPKPKPEPCDNGRPRCPDGSCVPIGECCPEDPSPICDEWETATCCHGERVCALPPATCQWASWLVYNEETCTCACPAGTIPGPGQFEIICCPESHPTHGNNYHCFGAAQPWVCAIGYIPHPTIPDVCCREDICGSAAAADGAGEGGREARTSRNTTRRGSGDQAPGRAPAGRGR
jgi:hypothetical protein